jgi:hypothetical protein
MSAVAYEQCQERIIRVIQIVQKLSLETNKVNLSLLNGFQKFILIPAAFTPADMEAMDHEMCKMQDMIGSNPPMKTPSLFSVVINAMNLDAIDLSTSHSRRDSLMLVPALTLSYPHREHKYETIVDDERNRLKGDLARLLHAGDITVQEALTLPSWCDFVTKEFNDPKVYQSIKSARAYGHRETVLTFKTLARIAWSDQHHQFTAEDVAELVQRPEAQNLPTNLLAPLVPMEHVGDNSRFHRLNAELDYLDKWWH